MRIAKEIKTPAEGLDALVAKYAVQTPAYQLEGGALLLEGEKMLLFPWRQERRYLEMKKLLWDGTLGALSQIRAMRTGPRAETLEAALYRELDLCLWWSEKRVENVFAVVAGQCANVLLRLTGGAVCIVEVASQFADGVAPLTRHELITTRGMTTDQAVDTQVRQESVYVFAGDAARAYTDVDFELYGLTQEDVALTRAAYELLTGKADRAEARARDAYLRTLLKAIDESARTGEKVALGEE